MFKSKNYFMKNALVYIVNDTLRFTLYDPQWYSYGIRSTVYNIQDTVQHV